MPTYVCHLVFRTAVSHAVNEAARRAAVTSYPDVQLSVEQWRIDRLALGAAVETSGQFELTIGEGLALSI